MVTTYDPMLHTTAQRELNALEPNDKDALTDLIKDVATHEEPSRHEKAKSLEGQPGLFRVRVGDMRAVLALEKPNLLVLKAGYRRKVYSNVDDLHERLS